jgi:uncharacterized membrane protein YraQ (UPF0718 family)
MVALYIITGICLLASLIADRGRTAEALKIAWKRFSAVGPYLVDITILASVLIYFLPAGDLARRLSDKKSLALGSALAIAAGAIALIPGLVAFPLCASLVKQGVPYTIVAGFSTSLMMVGLVTFPLERKMLGTRAALLRNAAGLAMAVVTTIVIGIVYGEIRP